MRGPWVLLVRIRRGERVTEVSHALVESGSDLECLDLLSEHLGKLVVDVVANAQPWS
jgi:hypothetical protein